MFTIIVATDLGLYIRFSCLEADSYDADELADEIQLPI